MLNAIDCSAPSHRDEHDSTCIHNIGLEACCITLAIEGPLDGAGVEQVGDRLLAVARSARINLVLDMSRMTVIGARGLELLMETATLLQNRELGLKLIGCTADVADLIDIIVPAGLLTMSENRETAASLVALSGGVPAAPVEGSQQLEQRHCERQDKAPVHTRQGPTRRSAGAALRVAH